MSNDLYILENFDKLVNELNSEPKTNGKIEILKAHQDLKPLIKRIWDTESTTGVTKKGIEVFAKKDKDIDALADKSVTLYELMDNLSKRVLTGDKAKATIIKYVARFPKYEELILRILEKKPRVRMSVALINKSFPGILERFSVCLANDFEQERFEQELQEAVDNKAWMSKKIDGVRCITKITWSESDDVQVQFFSRTGHEWTSLDVLKKDVQDNVVPKFTDEEIDEGVVFDGELIALDKDGAENFKETVSQSRKKDVQMTNPRYKIFDMVTLPVFEKREAGSVYGDRLFYLQELFSQIKPKHCELLEQTLYTTDAFERLRKKAEREKWEGIMIRMNHKYEGKRSYHLLKWKFSINEEFRVDDVTIEDMPFVNKTGGETIHRALKNVIIHYKKGEVAVGSGFSHKERIQFAKNPELILGKLITVQYQEAFYDEKTSQFSLRCPIFKALIGDKRDF